MANTPAIVRKAVSPDEEFAEHLNKAEEHLISAVKLVSRKGKPERHIDYQKRLVRAQEMVTTLFREELVRIRGPIKVRVKK